jgi:hypothetical protein
VLLQIQRPNPTGPEINRAREREPRDFEAAPAIHDSDDPIVSAWTSIGNRALEGDVWIAAAIQSMGHSVLAKLD